MKNFSFTEWLSSGGSLSTSSYTGKEAYSRNCWVYAAANRIALTASSAPLLFYEGKPNTVPSYDPSELITDYQHPVITLFNPPKYPVILSLRDLLYRTFLHLSIDGALFWVIERKGRVPVSIDIRSKSSITPILGGANQNELLGWTDTAYNKKLVLQDVLLIQEYKPDLSGSLSLSGQSPLDAARLSLDSEYNIGAWNASFFKVGMKAPLLIQSKGVLTKDQKSDIRKEIINYYSGIDGAHGALILQGSVTVTALAVGSKDIDFVMGKKLNREEILSVYGVPPSLVGLFEYSNYANAEEQTKTFWEQTLLPKMMAILDLIQTNILNVSFPGVYAEWDTTKVAGLKPDPVKYAPAAKTYSDIGYSPNQIAKILGMPGLVPDADFEKPKQSVTHSISNEQQPVADQSANTPPPKKPKKEVAQELPNYVTMLERKFKQLVSSDMMNWDEEFWKGSIVPFITSLTHHFGVPFSVIEPVIQKINKLTVQIIAENCNELAKILVMGIYNSSQRR